MSIEKEIVNGESIIEILNKKSNISVWVDENKRILSIVNISKQEKTEIPFADIIDCYIYKDDMTSGGIVQAIGLAFLAFMIGGILGAFSRMDAVSMVLATSLASITFLTCIIARDTNNVTRYLSINILTKDIKNPWHKIPIITNKIDKSSSDYNSYINYSNKIMATIKAIIESNKLAQ